MTDEYHEGPEVLERFKTLMTQVLRTPKGPSPFAKLKATKKAARKAAPKKRASGKESGKAGE